MIKKAKHKKTEMEIIHEYLISEGARELTDEEKQTEWYKNHMTQMEAEGKEYRKPQRKSQ